MKLLEDCKDLFGSLSKNNQDLLNKLLNAPDNETWEIARRIVVSPAPLLTLDMAVSRVIEGKTQKCPDPFTVYRAIDYAVKKHKQFLERPIDKEFGII